MDSPVLDHKTLRVGERYDALMFRPEHLAYFEHSYFTNFGYWEEDTTTQRQACERLMDKLLAFVPNLSGTILDVACGQGGTTRYLLNFYPPEAVTAVNISSKQLDKARQVAPGCSFHTMDATRLGFEDESFDTVICVEAAFHFNTREKFLREALRVLKPGGRLVLSDILMHEEAERNRQWRWAANYVEDLDAYRGVFDRVGFTDVEIVDATRPCWHGCYWFAVEYAHREYLEGRLDLPGLRKFLELTYGRAADIEYYLLAAGTKGR